MNRSMDKYSVEALCEAAGFTKQAHYAFLKRKKQNENLYNEVVDIVTNIRRYHPRIGLRKTWYMVKPDWIGRDQFIAIGVDLGLEIPKPKNYQRTTFSTRCNLFGNLAAMAPVYDINQVWVSDITYFYVNGTFFYITLIEDVYSRRILGCSASETLRAEACCKALKQALKERSGMNISNLIHHSDKGSQYNSDAYINILKEHEIRISMCDSVYENTHIERLNGTIKNEYLNHMKIKNIKDLVEHLKSAAFLYNHKRPHFSLNFLTPVGFENKLENIPSKDRAVMNLYADVLSKKRLYQSTLFI